MRLGGYRAKAVLVRIQKPKYSGTHVLAVRQRVVENAVGRGLHLLQTLPILVKFGLDGRHQGLCNLGVGWWGLAVEKRCNLRLRSKQGDIYITGSVRGEGT